MSVLSGAAGFYDFARYVIPKIAQEKTPESLMEALQQITISQGALGNHKVETKDNDQYFGFQLGIRKLKDGKIIKVD